MEKKEVFTTAEALKYVGISKQTFFLRVKAYGIVAANHNPALERQHNSLWHRADLDRIRRREKPVAEDKPPPRQVA